jgi:membrane associated rhomboid family serine protease
MSDNPETLLKPGRRREPFINAPWAVTLLVGALLALHGLRVAFGLPPDPFAFTSDDLAAHRWMGLVSYQFTHGSWLHVLMNAAGTLVFGAPLARLMGSGPRGAAAFLLFFLVCGVISALGYVPFAGVPAWSLVGCSGAASGLFAATVRIAEGRGRLGPLFGATVIQTTIVFSIANAILGLSGLTPGAGGMPVAWQAHIAGYLAGLILVGPFLRLAGVSHRDHALAH